MLYAIVLVGALCGFLLVWPVVVYVKDGRHLRRFPNASPTAGVWNLWFVYQAIIGNRYLALQERHHSHNGRVAPVLRIGPNNLSFTSAQAIKDIHGHGTVMEKGAHYDLIADTHRHLANVVDRQDHARKRRVLAAAFAAANLLQYAEKLEGKMSLFIKQMDQRCCQNPGIVPFADQTSSLTIDYRQWAILYTQEAITALGFSVDLGFLEKGNDMTTAERSDGSLYKAPYRQSIEDGMHKDCVLIAMPTWYKTLLAYMILLVPKFRRLNKGAQGFSDIVRHIVNQRLAMEKSEKPPNDFCSAILWNKQHQPNIYDYGEIFAEANVILNAGSDSTGLAMTEVVLLLIKNPVSLVKLREEVDSSISEDGVASYEKIRNLPYLRAVLDESMRLRAPSQFSLPRITPPEGASIDGYWIDGNVQVSTATHAIHMDPTIWGDPDKFRPERWLADSKRGDTIEACERSDKDLRSSFLVFTTGPRGCIGRNVTYMEQSIMLATFVSRYYFCIAPEMSLDWEPKRYETVVTLINELPLRIWRRDF